MFPFHSHLVRSLTDTRRTTDRVLVMQWTWSDVLVVFVILFVCSIVRTACGDPRGGQRILEKYSKLVSQQSMRFRWKRHVQDCGNSPL